MVKNQWRADDDPGSQEPVAALLRAAAAPTRPGPQPGEASALAAFRATQHIKRRSSMRSLTPVRAALAAAVSGGVLLTGGVAAAATGTLPGAAQDTARTWLAQVGVTVPGADEHSAGHADQRGPATTDTTGDAGTTDASAEDQGDTQEPTDAQGGKGAAVSDLARNTDATGVAKGAEISGLASDGKSKAGQHGKATERPSRTDGPAHKPTTAPQPTQGTDDGSQTDGGSSSGDAGGPAAASSGHRP